MVITAIGDAGLGGGDVEGDVDVVGLIIGLAVAGDIDVDVNADLGVDVGGDFKVEISTLNGRTVVLMTRPHHFR